MWGVFILLAALVAAEPECPPTHQELACIELLRVQYAYANADRDKNVAVWSRTINNDDISTVERAQQECSIAWNHAEAIVKGGSFSKREKEYEKDIEAARDALRQVRVALANSGDRI